MYRRNGRAIAHELGHILLGTAKHSALGLMRAKWTEHELRRGLPIDWMFSRDERQAMRGGLSARLRQLRPATTAAGSSPTTGAPGRFGS